MIKFRNAAGYERVTDWWSNGFQQIAFSRNDKAFIAINNEDFAMNAVIKTSLPEGRYCDVISGNFNGN